MRWIEITEDEAKDVAYKAYHRRENEARMQLKNNADKVATKYLSSRNINPDIIGNSQFDRAKEAVKEIGIEGNAQGNIDPEPAKIIAKHDIREVFKAKVNPVAKNYQERTQLSTIFSVIHSLPLINKKNGTENIPKKFFCRVPNGEFKIKNIPYGIDGVVYDGSKMYVVNMKLANSSNVINELSFFIETCKNNNIPYFVVFNDSKRMKDAIDYVDSKKNNNPNYSSKRRSNNKYIQNLRQSNSDSFLTMDEFALKLKDMGVTGISGGEYMKEDKNRALYQTIEEHLFDYLQKS